MPSKVYKQWRYGKIKLIAKFISDEILVRKQVGMKCEMIHCWEDALFDVAFYLKQL